jgi:peptide/nickel transport system substrate-binding protein
MLGWGTVTGDADYGLYALFHTSQHVPAGSNRSFYSNPEVDALLDEARTNPDPAAREALYAEALQIIRDDAPWIFLHSETQLVAVADEVQGLVIHPTERVLAFNVSLDCPSVPFRGNAARRSPGLSDVRSDLRCGAPSGGAASPWVR